MPPLDKAAHQNRWRHRSLSEKALLAFGMLALALALPPWPGAAMVAVTMTAAALLGARVPAGTWARAFAAPAGFMIAGAAPLMVGVGADGFSLAPGGLQAAAALVARALAALTCLLFLAATTPATDLVAATRRLGLPAEIADVALLTYRFLFLLADAAAAMHAAQAARLGHAGPKRRLVSLGMLVANLLPRAMERARRLETGLAARGFSGDMRILSPRAPASPGGLAAIALVEGIVLAAGAWPW